MEKTTRKLNDLLSQFLSLRNEVSEIADKTADAVFDSVESGDITKEEALTILTDNKLLPVANWICLPNFMDDCDYLIHIQLSIIWIICIHRILGIMNMLVGLKCLTKKALMNYMTSLKRIE